MSYSSEPHLYLQLKTSDTGSSDLSLIRPTGHPESTKSTVSARLIEYQTLALFNLHADTTTTNICMLLLLLLYVYKSGDCCFSAVRTRSSSRLSYERRVASGDLDEGGRRRRGGEAGVKEDLFTRGLHKSVRGRGSRDGGKTAYEMFLEDDGPYSRKLYPPLTPGNAIKITVYTSGGNLFKIIFRASAERVQALPINLRYIYKRFFSVAGNPDIQFGGWLKISC